MTATVEPIYVVFWFTTDDDGKKVCVRMSSAPNVNDTVEVGERLGLITRRRWRVDTEDENTIYCFLDITDLSAAEGVRQ